MNIGIIGYGWVGKSMHKLFPDAEVYVRERRLDSDAEIVNFTTNKDDINQCDIAFIAVPTPVKVDGTLDVSSVEECVKWCEAPLLVIRSTVNPGNCYEWKNKYHKKIVFQPEYLGETPNHPLINEANTPFLIIGGYSDDCRKLIELYQTVYNANIKIRQVSNYEAEVIKLTENRAIAFKVAQCQELYDVCKKAQIDYYTIRDAVYGDDPRMNLWWTFVFPDKRGMNSKCLPKDVYAWCAWAESLGYQPDITRAILERNAQWISQF